MCNEIARRVALGQLREDWADLKVPLIFPEGLPNLEPLESIRITDQALILRHADDGVAGVTRRWSWPAANNRPVYNYRSEGRDFANQGTSGRCLIPVDGFYEYTDPEPGSARGARKTKWQFTAASGAWFCIAGFWHAEPALGEGMAAEAFTLLTCDPGPDVAPYHHRQIVLPARRQWTGWLDGSLPAAAVCRPTRGGTLAVTRM